MLALSLSLLISRADSRCPKTFDYGHDVYCGDLLTDYENYLRTSCVSGNYGYDKLCTFDCCRDAMEDYAKLREKKCDRPIFKEVDIQISLQRLYCERNSTVGEFWCGDIISSSSLSLKSEIEASSIDCEQASCCKAKAYKLLYPETALIADLYMTACEIPAGACTNNGISWMSARISLYLCLFVFLFQMFL